MSSRRSAFSNLVNQLNTSFLLTQLPAFVSVWGLRTDKLRASWSLATNVFLEQLRPHLDDLLKSNKLLQQCQLNRENSRVQCIVHSSHEAQFLLVDLKFAVGDVVWIILRVVWIIVVWIILQLSYCWAADLPLDCCFTNRKTLLIDIF